MTQREIKRLDELMDGALTERFNERAEVALFEGDGGAWMLKAVENIRDWLTAALKGYNVEVIA